MLFIKKFGLVFSTIHIYYLSFKSILEKNQKTKKILFI